MSYAAVRKIVLTASQVLEFEKFITRDREHNSESWALQDWFTSLYKMLVKNKSFYKKYNVSCNNANLLGEPIQMVLDKKSALEVQELSWWAEELLQTSTLQDQTIRPHLLM